RPLVISIIGGTESERRELSDHLETMFPSIQTAGTMAEGGSSAEIEAAPAIVLDLGTRPATDRLGNDGACRPTDRVDNAESEVPVAAQPARRVRLLSLPGSIREAAQSVLTAALDEPLRHKRPLRRMP